MQVSVSERDFLKNLFMFFVILFDIFTIYQRDEHTWVSWKAFTKVQATAPYRPKYNFVAERQSYLSVEFPESFVHCGSIAGGFEEPVLKMHYFAVLFGDASAAAITHLIFFYLFCLFVMTLWSFNFEGFYLMVRSVK